MGHVVVSAEFGLVTKKCSLTVQLIGQKVFSDKGRNILRFLK